MSLSSCVHQVSYESDEYSSSVLGVDCKPWVVARVRERAHVCARLCVRVCASRMCVQACVRARECVYMYV